MPEGRSEGSQQTFCNQRKGRDSRNHTRKRFFYSS